MNISSQKLERFLRYFGWRVKNAISRKSQKERGKSDTIRNN